MKWVVTFRTMGVGACENRVPPFPRQIKEVAKNWLLPIANGKL